MYISTHTHTHTHAHIHAHAHTHTHTHMHTNTHTHTHTHTHKTARYTPLSSTVPIAARLCKPLMFIPGDRELPVGKLFSVERLTGLPIMYWFVARSFLIVKYDSSELDPTTDRQKDSGWCYYHCTAKLTLRICWAHATLILVCFVFWLLLLLLILLLLCCIHELGVVC